MALSLTGFGAPRASSHIDNPSFQRKAKGHFEAIIKGSDLLKKHDEYVVSNEIETAELFMNPKIEVEDSNGEKEEFWPPDMVPHPHPPGSEPKQPSDPQPCKR